MALGLKIIVTVGLLFGIAEVTANQGHPCNGIMRGFINDYTDCGSYFSCIDQMEYHQQCPKGLYFSQLLGKCDLAENVVCLRCPETGYLIYRHTNSCSTFTLCANGLDQTSECEAGSYFHEYTRSCFESKHVVCHICPTIGVAVVHNASTCKSYDLCNDGEIIGSFRCPSDKFFDRNTKRCVEAEYCPATSSKPLP